MSEDSGKPAQANQEIDLDNIEVEILIICKNQSQLNQAGSFLTRRGWPTTVISDLTKAIEFLAEKKPDFVLVSFSHPSPRISKLPDLITQTFNLTCLGFVESGDAQSGAKLNNSRLRYKISGQASGPSIHRTIRKILAERFNVGTEEKSSSGDRESREGAGSSLVKVKGSAGTAANGPGVIMQKSSANATRDKGPQMVKGQGAMGGDGTEGGGGASSSFSGSEGPGYGYGSDGDQIDPGENGSDFVPMSGDEGASASTSNKTRGPRKSLKALAGDGNFSGVNGEGTAGGNATSAGKKVDISQLTKALLSDDDEASGSADSSSSASSNPSTIGAVQDGFDPSRTSDADRYKNPSAKSLADLQAGQAAHAPSSKVPVMEYDSIQKDEEQKRAALEANKKAANKPGSIESGSSVASPVPIGESGSKGPASQSNSSTDEAKARQEQLAREQEAAELAAKDPIAAAQSLLQKAVEAAMARYCKTPPGAAPLPLEEITYVGVFPIESEAMPGYLVVVWQAPDLSSREAFLRECETEIRTAFNSMNVAGKITSGFWTQLPSVEFVAWADNKANFHFMTVHQKREVGVAFFRTQGPIPQARPAAGGMFALNVKDMSTDVAVNFKAYLYLKNNDKHFMYLRNGRKLQPEQKKRLLEKKVTEVVMKSVDLENLRQYLAAGYLSGLIIEFNEAIASASQLTRKSS